MAGKMFGWFYLSLIFFSGSSPALTSVNGHHCDAPVQTPLVQCLQSSISRDAADGLLDDFVADRLNAPNRTLSQAQVDALIGEWVGYFEDCGGYYNDDHPYTFDGPESLSLSETLYGLVIGKAAERRLGQAALQKPQKDALAEIFLGFFEELPGHKHEDGVYHFGSSPKMQEQVVAILDTNRRFGADEMELLFAYLLGLQSQFMLERFAEQTSGN